MVWTLIAMLCYIRSLDTSRRRWTWLFCVILALGLFSHISTIMLWPFCLYWTWLRERSFKTAFRRLLPSGLLLLLLLVLAVTITQKESSTWLSIDEIAVTEDPWFSRPESLRSLLWFLGRLFTTAHWLPIPFFKRQTWELYIGGVVLVGLLVIVWKRSEPGAVWATWTLLFLLPFLLISENIVLNLPSSPSRYLYMSTAGSSLLLGWMVQEACFRLRRWGGYLYSVALAGLLVSSYLSLKQTEILSLYSSGRYYTAGGDMERGIDRLKLAIARDRGRGIIDLEDTYVRLCQVLMFQGDPDFIAFLKEALRLFPQNHRFKINALVVSSVTADPAVQNQAFQAIDVLRRSGEIEELVAQLYFNLGCGLSVRNEHERAIQAYNQFLKFHPDRSDMLLTAYVELSRAYHKVGDLSGAVGALQKVIGIKPDRADAYFTLGLVYLAKGEFDAARAAYARGVEEFGAEEAKRNGAVGDLKEFIGRSVHADVAQEILEKHWE